MDSDVRHELIELHFAVRDSLADLLSNETSAALAALRTVTLQFLEREAVLVLNDPVVLAAFGLDAARANTGQDDVRIALEWVISSASDSAEMQHSVEQLRHCFLHHVRPYLSPTQRPPADSSGGGNDQPAAAS